MSAYFLFISDTGAVVAEELIEAPDNDTAVAESQAILRRHDNPHHLTGDLFISDDGHLRALGEVRA